MALDLLHRDCVNLTAWFERRGLGIDSDPEALFVDALEVLPWA